MKELNTLLIVLLFSFILLKALGIVAWSWWIVLAPFWIPLVGVYIMVTIGVFIQYLNHIDKDEDDN